MPVTARRRFVSRLIDHLFDLRAARPAPRLGRLETLEARDVPAAVPFGLPQAVLSGVGYPYTTTAADLNGDGRLDVLAAATDGSAIVWAAGLGDGAFGPKRTIDPGTASGFIANTYAADFDGDGSLDVLAAGDDILRVYLNDGAGTFAAPIDITTAGTFRAAFAADLDGDGDTDVATITNTDGTAVWYRNDGGGTFALAQTFGTGLAGARAMTAGDFDGDGDTDVVVGSNGVNKVVLFRNDGTGVFAAEELVTADIAGIRNLYAADLNGDGHLDLVSVAYGSSEVAWFENDGAGAFTKRVVSNVAAGFFAAAVGDIDGSGTPDLAVAAFDDSSVSWFSNDGAGNFGPRQVVSQVNGGGGLLAIGLGDVTGDGRLDVVAGDTTDPYTVAVYENRTGRFSTVVIPPAAGTALIGQAVDVKVHFGVPVAVTGAPTIDFDIGGVSRTAVYEAGTGTPVLTFRYVVTAADTDANGIALASAAVAGGTLLDPDGAAVNRNLPAADLSGTKVNGSAPLVASVVRLDPAATNAAAVRFAVTFSEPVTGVDAADFAPRGELAGAAVTGVTGSGAAYTVTLSTGTGSGSLGLSVANDGTVADAAGNALGVGFAGGEVYTLQRRPARTIDTFFTNDHGDIGVGFEDGALHPHVHTDDLGEVEADEVLIVAGPDALRTTPVGPQWAFLGAGPQSYLLPEVENPALPYLGIGAEEIAAGTLASYANADPRVAATGAWVKVQVVGYRAPAGAHVSIYNSGDPAPTVWVATSDGLTADDAVYVPVGSHGHFNFAFTAAGNYELDVVASGFRDANGNGTYDPGIDPYTESGVTTYYFQIDPPAGPTAVSLPADPLPPLPPAPPPPVAPAVARPVLTSGTADGLVRITHADGGTTAVNPFPGFTGAVRTTTADMTGDGVADVIAAVGAGAPHVKVLDGRTGRELRSFFAFDPAFAGGVSVAAGDVTGDGVPDLIVAAGPGAGPHVKVFDGATGAEVRSFFAYAPGFTGGVSVAAADLDGDGVADIVTGTLTGAPHVRAFDGRTGAEVLSFFAYDAAFTGGVFVAAGDLDGDGKAEVVTGTGAGGGSHVKLFDGETGVEVGGFMAYGESFRGGVRVAVADPDGDGRAEVVTGAGPGGAPHVKVFDGRPLALVDEFLAGDAGALGGVFVG